MKKIGGIWAYSILFSGLFLGLAVSCHTDDETPGTVSDASGNTYHIVTIGTQVWMAENLKTKKYRNGDLIGTTTPSTLDISSESASKYQWAYNGDENNEATYGRLYTWYAIADSRNVCPDGWHVPTMEEWDTLADYLGGDTAAGDKLKEIGTSHWPSPNAGASDESGFSALPGGFRNDVGEFQAIGSYGHWWSSSDVTATSSTFGRFLWYYNGELQMLYTSKGDGFSIRCIKD